jgi:hypothetical protein
LFSLLVNQITLMRIPTSPYSSKANEKVTTVYL